MAHGETYEQFVDKFKQKLTTDDCYTPPMVYEAVADFVSRQFGYGRSDMVRPFYPGGDYEHADYLPGCAVVDNPPFSILSRIVRFYVERSIPFFLFAPSLTLFGIRNVADLLFMPVFCDVTYENGAVVRTSFVSNMAEPGVWICNEFREAVNAASVQEAKAKKKPERPKYKMPDNVWNAATLGPIACHGIDVRIPSSDYAFIRRLDSMKEQGKSIFGGGLIFSDEAARTLSEARRAADEARRAADEARRAADEARRVTWTLSDAERAIIDGLNRPT